MKNSRGQLQNLNQYLEPLEILKTQSILDQMKNIKLKNITKKYISECVISLILNYEIKFNKPLCKWVFHGNLYDSLRDILEKENILNKLLVLRKSKKLSMFQYLKKDRFLSEIVYLPLEEQKIILTNSILQELSNDPILFNELKLKDGKISFNFKNLQNLPVTNQLILMYSKKLNRTKNYLKSVHRLKMRSKPTRTQNLSPYINNKASN